jgi:nitroreductase
MWRRSGALPSCIFRTATVETMNRRQLLAGGGALALAGAGVTYFGLRQMGSMEEYNASVLTTRAALSERPEMKDFIRYATLAASGHNTQPWRFRIGAGRIDILPDFSRRTPVVDPDDHHVFVSLGCAAENLALAAAARGHPGEIGFDPANDGSVVFAFADGPSASSTLFDAIPKRQSTRADYDGKPVSAADLQLLSSAAAIPGVDLILITDRPQIDRVRDLVVAGNSAQIADAAFLRELKTWLRFSPREAIQTGDGLFSASSGSPALPAWLGPRLFDWVFKAGAENDKYARQIASSAGIAVFVSQRDDREHWVLAGRACQRFALQATALGLKCAFINQPVEVAKLRPELATLVGLPGRRPDLVMRFGYGPLLPYSARRAAERTMLL